VERGRIDTSSNSKVARKHPKKLSMDIWKRVTKLYLKYTNQSVTKLEMKLVNYKKGTTKCSCTMQGKYKSLLEIC